jgi:hypothetical protein
VRTIICGSRNISNFDILEHAIVAAGWEISVVISGGARGVDTLAETWARLNAKPLEVFKPHWRLGRHAGVLRNLEMISVAEAMIAIWDGASPGTFHSIQNARKSNLVLSVYTPDW